MLLFFMINLGLQRNRRSSLWGLCTIGKSTFFLFLYILSSCLYIIYGCGEEINGSLDRGGPWWRCAVLQNWSYNRCYLWRMPKWCIEDIRERYRRSSDRRHVSILLEEGRRVDGYHVVWRLLKKGMYVGVLFIRNSLLENCKWMSTP